eukprot:COSAG04_NODE_7445_length_1127_cov_1.467899_1_plen_175_part_10
MEAVTDASAAQTREFSAGDVRVCKECSHPILVMPDFIKDGFVGRGGPACLYKALLPGAANMQPAETISMITGDHEAATALCKGCNADMGWKYVAVPSREPEFLFKLNNYVIGDELITAATTAQWDNSKHGTNTKVMRKSDKRCGVSIRDADSDGDIKIKFNDNGSVSGWVKTRDV